MARLTCFALCALVALLAAPAHCQPPGSNPGLPPSATATGLAAQKITDLAVRALQKEFNYSDVDLFQFLTNTECLEATFDSFAAFGQGMDPALFGNGPAPIGGRKANLSPTIQLWAEEVARDEIGHVRILREALGADSLPCPKLNIDTAFETLFNMALGTTGVKWDPYQDDIHFVLSTFALEEVGATGDAGVNVITATNGNLTNVAIAGGLAGSAYSQAAADRMILWARKDEIVPEFNKTVSEVFAGLSKLRQSLTGVVKVDQPLVFDCGINIVLTDGNGVTLTRTPQQVLNIVTGGAEDGKGLFFPEGVNGRIKTPQPLNLPVPEELLALNNAPYTVVQDDDNIDPFALPDVSSGPLPSTSGYDMMSSTSQCKLPSSQDICDSSTDMGDDSDMHDHEADMGDDSDSHDHEADMGDDSNMHDHEADMGVDSNSHDHEADSDDVSTRRNLRVFKGMF